MHKNLKNMLKERKENEKEKVEAVKVESLSCHDHSHINAPILKQQLNPKGVFC